MHKHVIGLDIGQARDYTAICAVRVELATKSEKTVFVKGHYEKHEEVEPVFHLGFLERLPLGMPFRQMMSRACEVSKKLDNAPIVADATGVGRPCIELLYEFGAPTVPVIITSGAHETLSDGYYKLPKANLITAAQIILQTRRITIPKKLPLASTFIRELDNFKVKTTAAGNDQFAAHRENEKDDMVLAVCLALWYASSNSPSTRENKLPGQEQEMLEYALSTITEDLWKID